ncbi:MAG: (deoxy)nucleoside triphosphate pyrophosphohydrolase [Thermodesulfobacteriota bacterium]
MREDGPAIPPAGPATATLPLICVTAAVIEEAGRILIAQRPAGDRLAGLWEFPGGKIEAGEEPAACLVRELYEELGVEVAVEECLLVHRHRYEHAVIELASYRVRHLAGTFQPHAHAALAWVRPQEMGRYPFAPADLPTVALVQAAFSGRVCSGEAGRT